LANETLEDIPESSRALAAVDIDLSGDKLSACIDELSNNRFWISDLFPGALEWALTEIKFQMFSNI
jgi:hypothetical protein